MLNTLSFDEAQLRFMLTFSPLTRSSQVPLSRALGRILAMPVYATVDQPPVDQSAMDGYAVRYSDIVQGAALRIQQRCYAGDVPAPLAPGCVTRIFTGSLIPLGADTVVMQEDAQEIDGCVTFAAAVHPNTHIRYQGEELRADHLLIEEGTRIKQGHIGLAAAQGIELVNVFHSTRVGILTIGDELVRPGCVRKVQQIYNSNAPLLVTLIEGIGATVTNELHVSDTERAIALALYELRSRCDLIVTAGGASVGEKDLVRAALTSEGASFVVTGVNMKPGKPAALARYAGIPVVVLPGNPGAVFSAFTLLAIPLIRRLQGRTNCLPLIYQLPISFETACDNGRDRFLKVCLETSANNTTSLQMTTQYGAMLTFASADGLCRLPKGISFSHGDVVPFYDFAHWLT